MSKQGEALDPAIAENFYGHYLQLNQDLLPLIEYCESRPTFSKFAMDAIAGRFFYETAQNCKNDEFGDDITIVVPNIVSNLPTLKKQGLGNEAYKVIKSIQENLTRRFNQPNGNSMATMLLINKSAVIIVQARPQWARTLNWPNQYDDYIKYLATIS